jgi:VIT1/CCC1 family predicted Fe2+/Mn2+ transporter
MGRLREVVFGVQDGLLSTVALVTGVAVAVGEQSIVLVAGFAGALPGMISMATGAFLASRAERDVRRAEIAREARELEENPAEEFAELVVLFQREGKSFAAARRLADDIAQDKGLWLRTMVEKELGLSADDTTNPMKDALTMGLAFILAALIPILPHLFLDGGMAIAVSVSAALLGLFALGVGKGFIVQKSPLRQGIEILVVGAISAAVGFGLGDGIPRLFA